MNEKLEISWMNLAPTTMVPYLYLQWVGDSDSAWFCLHARLDKKNGGHITFEFEMLTQKYRSKGEHTLCLHPLIAYGESSRMIWLAAEDSV